MAGARGEGTGQELPVGLAQAMAGETPRCSPRSQSGPFPAAVLVPQTCSCVSKPGWGLCAESSTKIPLKRGRGWFEIKMGFYG